MAAWPVVLDETPQFLAGALMLGLALALLALGFSGRMNRALAGYLVLAGTREILGSLDDPVGAPALTVWVFRTIPWLNVAIPFAALHVALLYRSLESRQPLSRWIPAALLGAAVLAEVAYFALEPYDAGSYAVYLRDPFIVFYAALPPLLAWVAVDFARRAALQPPERRSAFELAAVAFALHAAFAPALAFRYFHQIAGSMPLLQTTTLSAVVPVVIVVVLLLRSATSVGRRGSLAILATFAAGAAYVTLSVTQAPPEWLFSVTDGILRLGLPAILSYAILRHRLFDIDVRLKWTLSRGTIAAVFVAVFFVVAQVAQEFFADSFGWALGGVAAGLLVFAMTPLQRAAERLANAAMPSVRPVGLEEPERLDVYRCAVAQAWSDGAIDRSERGMLEALRARLGLTHEEAARIELDVAQEDAAA